MMMMIENVITADMMRVACADAVAKREERERQYQQEKEAAYVTAQIMAGDMAQAIFNKLRAIAADGESYEASTQNLQLTWAKRGQGEHDTWKLDGHTMYCPSRINWRCYEEAAFYWNIVEKILKAAGFNCKITYTYSKGYWKDFDTTISWGN